MKTKKETPFLDFYVKYMGIGKLRHKGLCYSLHFEGVDDTYGMDSCMDNFITREDRTQLFKEGKDNLFWGSDSSHMSAHEFTPLRQTIILLLAAEAGEL